MAAAASMQVCGLHPLRAPGVPRRMAVPHQLRVLRAVPPALRLFSCVCTQRTGDSFGA